MRLPLSITRKEFLTIKEASYVISKLVGRNISESNISYLINYGIISKYEENGKVFISLSELKNYYDE